MSQLTGKGYEVSDYTLMICYHAVTQTYHNCAETHLGGEVMSPFVSPCLPSLQHTIQLSSAV